ncbi:hypothetical protein GIB67_021469, partial [Kingdonia uniflora]
HMQKRLTSIKKRFCLLTRQISYRLLSGINGQNILKTMGFFLHFGLRKLPLLFWKAKMRVEMGSHYMNDTLTKIYGRDELLARLQVEAEAITVIRRNVGPADDDARHHQTFKHVVVGFVGYPNVGKSSTINALVGEKKTGVTSTPGKTKHFQTLIISDELMLCDCPGLVFPSFTSSRYEMIASGHVASSGLPDETRAARQILKDYLDGKLLHFEMPPGMTYHREEEGGDIPVAEVSSSVHTLDESDSSDANEDYSHQSLGSSAEDTKTRTLLENVFDDLDSFDTANGLAQALTKPEPIKKKPASASYKQHRKPVKKKDHSWRVGNDGGDGMLVVRVFQKSVNMGLVKAGV